MSLIYVSRVVCFLLYKLLKVKQKYIAVCSGSVQSNIIYNSITIEMFYCYMASWQYNHLS